MKRILIVVMTLLSLVAICQQNSDVVYWQANYKLSWNNFQGVPDTSSAWGAVSYSGLSYSSHFVSNDSLSFEVYCTFYKKLSWVKDNWRNTYSLNHEQKHFDITEIFARKLSSELNKLKYNYKTIDSDAKRLFNTINYQKDSMQMAYDKATTTPLNASHQQKWDTLIAQLLLLSEK